VSRGQFDIARAHAVVTGASRSIGAGLAAELARRGARVTVVARSREPLEALAKDVGGHAYPADLTDRSAVEALVPAVEDRYGPVDLLVNNAGMVDVAPFWELTAEQVHATLQLNLGTPLELTRQVLPGMLKRRRGYVVNVSSFGALSVVPTVAPYCTSKAGLAHFTATVQRELRGSPVQVMIAHLGQVDGTEMMADAFGSPPILVATRRLDRIGIVPGVSIDQVARGVCDAVTAGRASVVIPKRMTPVHEIRELPNRLNDLLTAGAEAKLELP
jgi:short-subunit dehydrogenase